MHQLWKSSFFKSASTSLVWMSACQKVSTIQIWKVGPGWRGQQQGGGEERRRGDPSSFWLLLGSSSGFSLGGVLASPWVEFWLLLGWRPTGNWGPPLLPPYFPPPPPFSLPSSLIHQTVRNISMGSGHMFLTVWLNTRQRFSEFRQSGAFGAVTHSVRQAE